MSRNIPDTITAEHIKAAAEAFDEGAEHEFWDSTHYDVIIGGKPYPPKAIIGLAAHKAAGVSLTPDDFSAGIGSKCFGVLEKLGFDIESKISEEDFIAALVALKPRLQLGAKQILLAQYLNENHTISPVELAEACGFSDGDQANLRYGNTAKLLAEQLSFTTQKKGEKKFHWWRAASIPDRSEDGFRWRMRPELVSAMQKSNFTERGTQFWWVNHNADSFEIEITKGPPHLWAPQKHKNGKSVYHWTNVSHVRKGDVIIHYSSKKSVQSIVGIGCAASDGYSSDRTKGLVESWNKQGWKVDVEYYELKEPIAKDTVAEEIRALDLDGGPINNKGNANQGYLFGVAEAAAQVIARKIPGDLLPAEIMKKILGEPVDLPGRWMFQMNPKNYDVRALTELDEISWRSNRYLDDIKAGDTVYIWVSGKESGVYCTGVTSTEPGNLKLLPNEESYNLREDKLPQTSLRARVKIQRRLKTRISRDECLNHPLLKDMHIVRAPHGSIFKVTEQEHNAIQKILNEGEEPNVKSEPYTVEDALEDLFLDHEQIEEIVDSLRLKKNVVLQGPPGVGKTFVARRLAYLLIGERKPTNVEMVQFHQSYAYEDFVQGLRPDPEGEGASFKLTDGKFYDFCSTARMRPNENFVFIIDEINRGNLSKIFGELLMLIEADKRSEDYEIKLTYSDVRFYIPSNVHILGMMNTADRSLAMVDYALRRRFRFFDIEPQFGEKFQKHLASAGANQKLIDKIVKRLSELNKAISSDDKNLGKGFCVGHSYFCPPAEIDKPDASWYAGVIKGEIQPLLNEYWFDDTTKAEEEVGKLL